MKIKKYVIRNTILTAIIMTAFVIAAIDNFIIGNKKISLLVFVTGYILLVYFGMRMSIRYKKTNVLDTLLNVLSPLGAYLFAWFSIEVSKKYLINTAIIIIVAAVLEFFWVESDTALKKRVHNFKKYLCTELRTMICITAVVMGTVVMCGQVKAQVAAQQADAIYQEWDEYRVEDSLEYNMEEAATIEKWNELDRKEKNDLLDLYLRIESRYWGMMDQPKLKVETLGENLAGQYVREEDTIYIAKSIFDQEDGYEVLFTLFHEMTHRQQHIQVELYYELREDKKYEEYYENSIWLDTMTYAKEFANYVSADVDPEAYNSQKLEIDADHYAAKGVLECQERIEKYLEMK